MADYQKLIDKEYWNFIHKTNSCYPPDTATRSIEQQRTIYNEMCKAFHAGRPDGLSVENMKIENVPIRIYGKPSEIVVVYFHGGGFVVGDLDSHDDVCAELAHNCELQVISVDYRLSPEHEHPAAYQDALSIVNWALEKNQVILVGDSAGGNLAAAVSGTLRDKIKAQVLIYPGLGGDHNKGSYMTHANAPMLTRDEILFYMSIRKDHFDDPTAKPLLGPFEKLPLTLALAAECDPLHDDCYEYVNKINQFGGRAIALTDKGLTHGHLRARHISKRAGNSFAKICASISAFSKDIWQFN